MKRGAVSARFAGPVLRRVPRFWMNLQADYDLRLAERQSGELIARTVVARASA
jgi:plasmid maintenance system antidote protein VapI